MQLPWAKKKVLIRVLGSLVLHVLACVLGQIYRFFLVIWCLGVKILVRIRSGQMGLQI